MVAGADVAALPVSSLSRKRLVGCKRVQSTLLSPIAKLAPPCTSLAQPVMSPWQVTCEHNSGCIGSDAAAMHQPSTCTPWRLKPLSGPVESITPPHVTNMHSSQRLLGLLSHHPEPTCLQTYTCLLLLLLPAAADADASATSNGGFATADADATARVRGDGVAKASEYRDLRGLPSQQHRGCIHNPRS
jgi:hypothetical protein